MAQLQRPPGKACPAGPEVGTRQPRPIILPRMSSQSAASIYPGLGSQSVLHPAPPTVPSHWQMPGSPRCPPSHSSPLHPAPHSGLNIPQFFSLLSILSAAAWPRPPPSPAALPASMPVSHQARSPPHSQRPSFLTSPTCMGSHRPGGPRGPSQSGASAEPRQSDRVHAWALEPHCLSRPLTGCETGPQFAHLLNGDVRVNHGKLPFFALQPVKGSHPTERAGSDNANTDEHRCSPGVSCHVVEMILITLRAPPPGRSPILAFHTHPRSLVNHQLFLAWGPTQGSLPSPFNPPPKSGYASPLDS